VLVPNSCPQFDPLGQKSWQRSFRFKLACDTPEHAPIRCDNSATGRGKLKAGEARNRGVAVTLNIG
jgi:hypothetical protein